MSKGKRLAAVFFTTLGVMAGPAAAALADAPGPGSRLQCAGGQFPGANGNPHCPQNGGK